MTIRGWKTRYREIRGMFGYKESDDIASAKKLNSIIGKKIPSSNFKKKIFGKTVFVIGAGPSLDNAIKLVLHQIMWNRALTVLGQLEMNSVGIDAGIGLSRDS